MAGDRDPSCDVSGHLSGLWTTSRGARLPADVQALPGLFERKPVPEVPQLLQRGVGEEAPAVEEGVAVIVLDVLSRGGGWYVGVDGYDPVGEASRSAELLGRLRPREQNASAVAGSPSWNGSAVAGSAPSIPSSTGWPATIAARTAVDGAASGLGYRPLIVA